MSPRGRFSLPVKGRDANFPVIKRSTTATTSGLLPHGSMGTAPPGSGNGPTASLSRRASSHGSGKKWGASELLLLLTVCVIGVCLAFTITRQHGGEDGDVLLHVTTPLWTVKVPAETVPVSIGRRLQSGSGTIDAQVYMCELDRDTYFHQPYKYPMFKDLVKLSGGCTGKASSVTTISALQAKIDENPSGYLEPTGFVFHMSRCGSTLTANLLGSSPYNLVYSESKPPVGVMSLCDSAHCTDEGRVAALRTVIRAMGKTSFHKHMFFKFQSSQTVLIDTYRKAFPNTPWVFVYRDPVPVLMSLVGHKIGAAQSSAATSPCLRTKRRPPVETAIFLGMSQDAATHAPDERYCAAHLAGLCNAALASAEAAGASEHYANGTMVDYETLPNAIVPLLEQHFHAPLAPAEELYALEISTWYAKSRGAVRDFTPDTKAKEDHASVQINEAAADILEPLYGRLHSKSLPASAIPSKLAAGRNPAQPEKQEAETSESSGARELTDEEFYAIPEHLRGLDRVVDPKAPDFMASGKWKSLPVEPFECPDVPPVGYPKGFPIMDVINHWNPDDASHVPETHYLSICRFDFQREFHKADRYSQAEKPFILYNIPSVDATAARWSSPKYMETILGKNTKYATEHSTDNHFMYFNHKLAKSALKGKNPNVQLTDWKPPTDSVNLSYRQWLDLALKYGKDDGEHWYFRVGDANNKVILEEMEIFQPPRGGQGNIFLREPKGQRGIHCRFGMPGVIAEAHFDGSRNMVAMISGVRRWIMAHPNQCETMYLLPSGHPSGRHSDVDWSAPDLERFPDFPGTLVNEVLLKAGEVLYVPTEWFHYISNIGVNAQCNSRSGVSMEYDKDLAKCGFGNAARKVSPTRRHVGAGPRNLLSKEKDESR